MATGYNPRTNALARKKTRERFLRVRAKGKTFTRQLVAVAEQIALLLNGFAPTVATDLQTLEQALYRYADILTPWAKIVSEQMIAQLNQRDEQAWFELSKEIGRELRAELRSADMEDVIYNLRQEQIDLITSLPREAASMVHELSMEAIGNGERASTITERIAKLGDITESRARTIARTEISRTASMLLTARAEAVGSTQYIWRTSHDSDVRHRHQELDGKVFFYKDPPIAGERGERANPGEIYNCRCFIDPILPD